MITPDTCILIAGPTTSGKSALALEIAERVNGAIINADSMQVYRELRILTARPSDDDMVRVPHYLFGTVPVRDAYSVGRYVKDASDAIAAVGADGRVPIFVGGTGLYFKALLDGLSPVPAIDPAVRQRWRSAADDMAPGALYAVLVERDPEIADRLSPADTQRIVRALEVIDQTGRSLLHWHRQPGDPVISADAAVRLVLLPSRAELRERAEARFDAMMAGGALDEARLMASLNLDPALPATRAIGVGPLIGAVRGEASLEAAILTAKAETHQYIKRQTTWIRRQMITWNLLEAQEMESNIAKSIAFIQS